MMRLAITVYLQIGSEDDSQLLVNKKQQVNEISYKLLLILVKISAKKNYLNLTTPIGDMKI